MAVIEESEESEDACCRASDLAEGGKLSAVRVVAISAGARVLFYPTLFYNVVRNSIEQDFRWWDQIDEFLLLGAVPFRRHVLLLKNAGVRGVVTLNESFETLVNTRFYEENGIRHCVIPTKDYFFAPSVGDIRRAVNFIREHVLRGETTYVHCKAGRGRSTTVALCYLVEYRGMNPLDAFDYVRAIRRRVLLARSQWEAVWEYTRVYCSTRLLRSPSSCIVSSSTDDEETCLCITCEEPVLITSEDLAGYEEPEKRWIILKNLGLVLSYLLRMKKKMGSIEMSCKPVVHPAAAQDFSIQLTAY